MVQLPFERKDGKETLICSEALFEKLTGERNYTIIDIQLGGIWHIPIELMLTVFVIVVLSCIAAVYAPSKRIKNMSITDVIYA